MTKRKRTFLFLSVACFFFLATPFVILYSQGYRFDWLTKHIIKTGGIHIEATPSQVDIFLNNTFTKRTSYIFDSTFLGDLAPAFYAIRIEKEGFTPWEKILEVKATQLAQIRNVILFPKKPMFQTTLQNVRQFWPSPSGKDMIIQKNTPEENAWELILWDPAKTGNKIIMQGPPSQDIASLTWNQDSTRILVHTVSDKEEKRLIWNVRGSQRDACVLVSCSLDFLGKSVLHASFVPESNTLLLVTRQTGDSAEVLVANYITKSVQAAVSNALAAQANENYLFSLGTDGILRKQNISLQQESQTLTDDPYPVQAETRYEIILVENDILVRQDDALLELTSEKKLVPFISKTRETSFDKDKRRIAHTDGSSLFVSLTNMQVDPISTQRTSLLVPASERISNLLWLQDSHIFFARGDQIFVAETDSRDRVNTALLGTFSNPSLFWHEKTKTLYVLSQGFVFASERLVQ